MSSHRQKVSEALATVAVRLDAILNPWGFTFVADDIQSSHCGPFASGHYCRATTKIGISCRDSIDNIYYYHTFVTRYACSTEFESFTIGHRMLMDALGHAHDCQLIETHGIPNAVSARDGADPLDALSSDLTKFAFAVLREPCDEFYRIVRRGYRSFSIA